MSVEVQLLPRKLRFFISAERREQLLNQMQEGGGGPGWVEGDEGVWWWSCLVVELGAHRMRDLTARA